MVLLLIGYIPDDVIQDPEFSLKPGFKARFKKLMDKFKEKFEKDKGVQWQYQSEELEEKYY